MPEMSAANYSEWVVTLWEFLGVPSTCTIEEMKAAWRKKCLQYHPDKTGNDPKKTAIFIEAKNLYEQALKWKETTAPIKSVFENSQDSVDIGANEILARMQRMAQQQSQSSAAPGASNYFFNQFFRRFK